METITQTNRTLLFSEINPERLNLLTLIGDVRGKNSLDDDKIKEINEELVVSGFNDFLDKFSPVVYSWCDASSESIEEALNGIHAGKLQSEGMHTFPYPSAFNHSYRQTLNFLGGSIRSAFRSSSNNSPMGICFL